MLFNFQRIALCILPPAMVMAGLSPALAQEEATTETEEAIVVQMAVDDESGGEPIIVSSSSFTINGEPGSEGSFGFVSGGDIMGMGGNWTPRAMDPMALLDDEQVRADLDLVGEQLDKYKAAQKLFRDQLQEKTKSITSGKL